MTFTATDLRNDIYNILDKVLETGTPVSIERKGRLLQLVPVEPKDRLAAIPTFSDLITGDAADLAHVDWSSEWKP